MALNNWTANGRLTKDSELRYTQEGLGVMNFTLAIQRDYKVGDDRPADFINCVMFGSKDAEKCRATKLAEYMNKGTLVNVVARIQSRSYENADGFTVYVTEAVVEEVYLISQPKQDEPAPPPPPANNRQGNTNNRNSNSRTNTRNTR